ncbi:SAP domain-containing ribonucleoprotein isoform X2 [Alosa pseudoharengus]|uniref:SAP domain-containing ribonucleoprotein isoform X2 n=1 Tax=Alosa sapidissima TaxID=34773 RepID=UPI001C090153|nr:SAP domain-containing ribonucleoprotein isoform X2 [Alosa sapidissima]
MAEVVELQKLKLAELKQECTARGLDAKGNKGDLIARLQAYLEEHDEEVNEEEVLGDFAEESFSKDETSPPKVVKTSDDEPEPAAPEKKVVKITLSESGDELLKRAERFNMPPTAENKKAARAARFGLPATASSASSEGASISAKTPVSVEVLKKRAERFGMNVSSISKKVEEDEKLKKRKERFGAVLAGAGAAGSEDAEAKKRKRAERFGNV